MVLLRDLFGCRRRRVQLVELRVPVEERQVGVAAGPARILEACLPRLTQGIQGLLLTAELSESAGDVVEDYGVVRAQGHGEARLTDSIVGPSHLRVVGSEQRAAPGILRHLSEMRLENLDSLLDEVAEGFFLAERPQGVDDRYVD